MEDNITPIKEKLDDKIKKLNSSRVFKKVTHKKVTLSWYIKWRTKYGVNLMYGKCKCKLISLNLYFGMIGVAGWFWVGVLWHDRGLIMLNVLYHLQYI